MANKKIKTEVTLKNFPSYELEPYTVARADSAEFWFYGTYETIDRAIEVARSLGNGVVFENAEVV